MSQIDLTAGTHSVNSIGVVAIGRNEGDRLRRCLASLSGRFDPVVYVDSGSTDDSLKIAADAGATIVELDTGKPFTAARARNAGYAALRRLRPGQALVQFVDGDCSLLPDWPAAAVAHLEAHPGLGLVTGWRSEIHRDATIYNAICDVEWHRPAGEIDACGGDMLVRSKAFEAIGGFDETLIAGEDEDFCVRLRRAGWNLERLPLGMTRHDAAMTRFSQWWQRAIRSGHAFANVGDKYPEHFQRERQRVWLYGAIFPAIALIGLRFGWSIPAAVALLYLVSYIKTAMGLRHQGLKAQEAAAHSIFLTLSKFPNLAGMLIYYFRKLTRQTMTLIEYK